MKRVITSTLLDYREVYAFVFCDPSQRQDVIEAAINTRDLTKDMARVKSSNIWSYGFHVRNQGDDTGDLVMQFKDKNGGPDDIYIYYRVPIRVYQKLISAPSKGHAFWKYIRNNFTYAKLTGDRRTHLPNGVNTTYSR